MIYKKSIRFIFWYATISKLCFAVSATPETLTFIQPDGFEFIGFCRGDEWQAWHETLDGWSIVKNENNYWVYAIGVNGQRLESSQAIVGLESPPSFTTNGALLQKHLHPERMIDFEHSTDFSIRDMRSTIFTLPVLLVEYPDYGAVTDQDVIDNLFNEEGYGHPGYSGSGSFKDFYLEISYGQFTPIATVSQWFTAPNNHNYYADSENNSSQRTRQLVRAIVDSAEAAGMDWAQFDNDGDGSVEGLTIVHAGPGAEQGDLSNIWSHRWNLGNLAVQYDGVLISDYCINPEIQSGNVTAIGVICHEFGHILGLPDLYDTDYSSSGAGKLALMASGSWGTAGNTPWYPSAMNAWSKLEMGWGNNVLLNTNLQNIDIEQSFSNNTVYRINNQNDNTEYWLVENRQRRGTDINMHSPGLLFWHIDTEKTNGWSPNNDEPHYGVGLEQADGLFDLENDGTSDAGDPYPGSTGNHKLSRCTTPNSNSYYDLPSFVSIENISTPDSIMTFDLSFGEITTNDIYGIGSGNAFDVGNLVIFIENTETITALQFDFFSNSNILSIESLELTGRATADSISYIDQTIYFYNPIIPPGDGAIITMEVFANTGTGQEIELIFDDIAAADSEENEMCLLPHPSYFTALNLTQTVSIDTGYSVAGGSGAFNINLDNSVPIRSTRIAVKDSPNYLTPAAEPFTDNNGNTFWDDNEPFTDWNNDSTWTPMVELTERTANWVLNVYETDDGLVILAGNSVETIAIGSGPIFIVNNLINSNTANSQVDIEFTIVELTDMYGNPYLNYEATTGVFYITENMSNSETDVFPRKFQLAQNYPNPFNPITTLRYDLPENGLVTIIIYDMLGKQVKTLINQTQDAGSRSVFWNATNDYGKPVSAGIYLYQIQAGEYISTKKMVLLK